MLANLTLRLKKKGGEGVTCIFNAQKEISVVPEGDSEQRWILCLCSSRKPVMNKDAWQGAEWGTNSHVTALHPLEEVLA